MLLKIKAVDLQDCDKCAGNGATGVFMRHDQNISSLFEHLRAFNWVSSRDFASRILKSMKALRPREDTKTRDYERSEAMKANYHPKKRAFAMQAYSIEQQENVHEKVRRKCCHWRCSHELNVTGCLPPGLGRWFPALGKTAMFYHYIPLNSPKGKTTGIHAHPCEHNALNLILKNAQQRLSQIIMHALIFTRHT